MLNKGPIAVPQTCANNLTIDLLDLARSRWQWYYMHGINVLPHYPTSGSNLTLKCDPILGDGI